MGGTGGAGEPKRGEPRMARLGDAVEARGGGTIAGGVSSPPYERKRLIGLANVRQRLEERNATDLARVIHPPLELLIVVEGLLFS